MSDKVELADRRSNGDSREIENNESEERLGNDVKINHHRFMSEETLKKIRAIAAGPVRLLLGLVVYTAIGGLIFRELELPSELRRLGRIRGALYEQRRDFIGTILNNTDVSNLASLMSQELRRYERVVREAAEQGALGDDIFTDPRDPLLVVTERWSVIQAIFFASTVLTTIGYGNVFPATNWGRAFCIAFAFGGIPLTLSVIADWGKLFAEAVSSIATRIGSKLPEATTRSWIPKNDAGRRSLGAFAAALLLCLYLAFGAGLFMLWEEDWGFFDGFYFCFVTMTTIGFGDLVPKKPKYMLLCTMYILVGLALTGTIIELVRRQYARSWRTIRALSGPLAETLKRLTEQAGGDVSSLQSDLRRVLAVMSVPRLGRTASGRTGDVVDVEWEKAVEAVLRDITSTSDAPKLDEKSATTVVRIVIYESSV